MDPETGGSHFLDAEWIGTAGEQLFLASVEEGVKSKYESGILWGEIASDARNVLKDEPCQLVTCRSVRLRLQTTQQRCENRVERGYLRLPFTACLDREEGREEDAWERMDPAKMEAR